MNASDKKLRKQLAALLRNAIALHTSEATVEPPLGTSKMGGRPHLPKDFAWPRCEGMGIRPDWLSDGDEIQPGDLPAYEVHADRPLSFLAQINLSDLKEVDKDRLLPRKGFLYFFLEYLFCYAANEQETPDYARVFYCDVPAKELAVTDFPADLHPAVCMPLARISCEAVPTLPMYDEFMERIGCNMPGTSAYTPEDAPLYEQVAEELAPRRECALTEMNKLLGYADLIDYAIFSHHVIEEYEEEHLDDGKDLMSEEPKGLAQSVRFMLRSSKLFRRINDQILLAQFTTRLPDAVSCGETDRIYFYIDKKDLAARRFEKAYAYHDLCDTTDAG